MLMKRLLTRVLGLVLIVGGLSGLVFCIAALVVIAHTSEQITAGVMARVELVSRALDTTADGLSLADASLKKAQGTFSLMITATHSLAQSIGDNKPLVDSFATLASEDLPATITATQTSLAAAQASAKLVDDTLSLLSALPFAQVLHYAPPVPLHTSLAEISHNLDGLSASFQKMQAGLHTTSGNLERVATDITNLADKMEEIASSLTDARGVISRYQEVVISLQADLLRLHTGLPGWLRLARWGISLVLVWLGIAQLGLLVQGLELIGHK